MPDENPFKNAYDPLQAGTSQVVKCPVCSKQNFDARSNEYGVHRKCRECGNEWSGGGVGFFPEGHPYIPDAPAEDDHPIVQFTGAPYRRFGGDE
jgi:hypothetical protein